MVKNHILFSLLNHLGIRFTNYYLAQLTNGIPGSNTLWGLASILKERYHIACVNLMIEKDDFFKLDTPFVVQLNVPLNPLVLVIGVQPDKITYVYKNEKISEPANIFLSRWGGTVLLAEPEENSREDKYWQNLGLEVLRKTRLPIIFILSAALLVYFGQSSLSNFFLKDWTSIALLFAYAFGLALSSLLLSQSINKSDSFVSKICNAGSKKGCSKILEGEASMIFGLVSWSEIGFLYFAGSVLTSLFVANNATILFTMSVMALPYTFWSIFYQWKVARQWCQFCVTVQLTLWLIFILHLINLQNLIWVFNVQIFIQTTVCFLIPALILWLVIPYAKSHQELTTVKTDFGNFKFNGQIIESALMLNPTVDTSKASSIIFGNVESSLRISVVTDVTCPHCIEAHQYLKEVLRLSRDNVSIQIIFLMPKHQASAGKYYNDTVDEKNIIVKHLISIYKSYDLENAEVIFHEWYEHGKKNYKKFMQLYPVEKNVSGVDQEIENHNNWCDNVFMTGTPTFFINQYRLPEWYKASELKDLVDILAV